MIKNHQLIQNFEKDLIKNEMIDVIKNFQMVAAMYQEAVELGIIPLKNPLDGLEIDIKIARVVNSVSEASGKNSQRTK